MSNIDLMYLINDEVVKSNYFYRKLEFCVFSLFPCCLYIIEDEKKKFRRFKKDLLNGFIINVAGVKFQILRGIK